MVARGRLQMMCVCMRTSDWWKCNVCFVVDVILLAFRNFTFIEVISCLSQSVNYCLSVYAHFHEIHTATVPRVDNYDVIN